MLKHKGEVIALGHVDHSDTFVALHMLDSEFIRKVLAVWSAGLPADAW